MKVFSKIVFLFMLLLILSLISCGGYLGRRLISDSRCRDEYGCGDGTESNPYLISNLYDLENFINHCNEDNNSECSKSFKMTDNIDLSFYDGSTVDKTFKMIGSVTNPFTGNFDGNNKTIYNMTLTNIPFLEENIGFFRVSQGIIKNLTLLDIQINASTTNNKVGGLVGSASGEISNCHVFGDGSLGSPDIESASDTGGLVGYAERLKVANSSTNLFIRSEYDRVGGLIGDARYTLIEHSNAKGDFDTDYFVTSGDNGGLVGRLRSSVINSSYAEGDLGGYQNVGGLVGSADSSSIIFSSYAVGDVSSIDVGAIPSSFGGLVGYNQGIISDSYSTGDVMAGDEYAGGLVGNNRGMIKNCYSSGNVIGTGDSSDYYGGFVGYMGNGKIYNSISLGNVTGDDSIGSFIGGGIGTYEYSVGVGIVSGNTNVGGFIGSDLGSTYSSVFWNQTLNDALTGVGNMVDPLNVVGETTINLYDLDTYIAAGWDFIGESVNGTLDPWGDVQENNYPRLWFQTSSAYSNTFAGGSGTKTDPYLIADLDDLIEMDEQTRYYSSYFALSSNIDLTAISMKSLMRSGFIKGLDGRGHIISNLDISEGTLNNVGFFSIIPPFTEIKNLGFENISIVGNYYTGGIAGINFGTIRDSFVKGIIDSNESLTGGIVGRNYYIVENVYSVATISALGRDVGGILGDDGFSLGAAYNSFSASIVQGDSGITDIGPFAGDPSLSSQLGNNFYWSGGTCTNTSGACNTYGTEIAEIIYFYNPSNHPMSLWDFNTIWKEESEDFPSLIEQNM